MKSFTSSLITTALLLLVFAGFADAATRDEILKRDYLLCGVSTGIPGFSSADSKGNWSGFDVEICRAVAVATLGDASKVKFVPVTAKERFTALQSGDVDVLSRNSTWTLTRDTSLGLDFTGISYYGDQGFMVSKSLGVTKALSLDGAAICVQSGTTTELNLADFFKQNHMTYKPIIFDTSNQTVKGFESGRCNVLSSDRAQLLALRSTFAHPEDAIILPEIISKEPQGPVVRQGDDAWFNIVRWALYAMINGEELGLTSENIESLKGSDNPAIQRFIGLAGIKGEGLGIADDWAYQIIRQVGNYGEVFERTVGSNSPFKIRRGLNGLWTDGGLQYAPPIR
ncbi:amino acid ABC transporter substrate-binding protein [Desulfosediminicola flagellatus]|uniref:amino acid ABC transporter substrate-binding protein n=1 Tax=Desulfosediminicola flagellatus TaxID=2569541 RepID=UPI0010AD969E|nr:amino acid ABC transporter substrate-binding protein [Desulfosediminicola flagellatus]